MVKVNLYRAILFIPGLLFGMNSFSQQAAISNTSPKASFGFIENKGQIHDQDYKPNPTVKYLLILNNGLNVQLKDNSFSYDTYIFERTKKEKEEEEPDILRHPFDSVDNYDNTYHFHRIDIELLNANPNPEIIAEGASGDYLNYYNAVTPEEGATGIRSYQKVTYKDMYPGIDLEFVAKPATEKPVEYNFIIHPGADGSRIRLKYRGAIETQLAENQIKIRVAQGWLYESIPASMVKEDNQNLAVKYKAFGQNEFGLQIPEYDPFKTLFIDPMPGLDWGTYYGGNIQDYGKALSIDKSKNIYVVGYTNSTSSMATSGVHQDSFGGGNEDVFIAKLTNKGQRIWGTYYGGSGSDIGNDIVLDGNENILITGSTASNWAIATFGTHQANYGGGYCDAFVGKFSTSGKRIWASYLGGSEGDYGNSICADVNDYVIITGHTRSSKSIASNGAFQTTYSGFNDAFVAKFSKNGQRQWGTYFGGSAWDVSNAIATDKSGNTYIAGITKSSSGIATSGAYKSTSSGSYDGFIAKFNASGQRIWGTYYGGWGDEIITAITLDIHGDVLFSGHDYYNAFLAKFKASGQIKWATNYGSGTTDSRSIRCDDIGNVFITGSTGSSINIASAAAYQKVLHGNCDAYVAKFNSNGQFVWGTYYGGYLSENANDVDVYGHGKVIIAGYTNSTSNIAITNVHQLNKSGYNDAFVAQFSGCNPSCDSLTIYACDSFDFNGTVLFKPGIYYDTLANYENCDSIIKLFLYFHAHPRADFTVHDSMQCLSDNVFYFSNQSSIDSGNYSSFWSFGDHENSLSVSPAHSFPHADTFFVRLTTVSDSGCSDWIEKKAIVHPLPLAAFFVNDSVQCQEKNNFIFTNTSTSVDSLKSYFWEFGDGDSSGQVNPVHTYGYIDTFQVRLIASSLFDCVDTFESFVYVADPVLGVQIGINDALQCMENNVFQFTNTSSIQNGTFTSHWDFGDGLSSTDQNPKHSYGTDDTFEVKLMVTTQEGCRDSTLAKVYVFPMPLAAFRVKDSQQCVKDNLVEFANFSSIPYVYNSYTWLCVDVTVS
ncbi:MAG: SBBP repeat-containing protein, partial [Bacteroidetes bacterium]|nr:SBBP repeat-containing protein [Bacteroidota bacterium]